MLSRTVYCNGPSSRSNCQITESVVHDLHSPMFQKPVILLVVSPSLLAIESVLQDENFTQVGYIQGHVIYIICHVELWTVPLFGNQNMVWIWPVASPSLLTSLFPQINTSLRAMFLISIVRLILLDFPHHTMSYKIILCIRSSQLCVYLYTYLNGNGSGKGTHIVCSLSIIRSEHDNLLRWPFKQSVCFTLINHEDPAASVAGCWPMPQTYAAHHFRNQSMIWTLPVVACIEVHRETCPNKKFCALGCGKHFHKADLKNQSAQRDHYHASARFYVQWYPEWSRKQCARSCYVMLCASSYGVLPGEHPKKVPQTAACAVIRESVDYLCRDGADTPIVRVHRKAFLTRERSRSKPFWALSYSIPVVFYPTIPPK